MVEINPRAVVDDKKVKVKPVFLVERQYVYQVYNFGFGCYGATVCQLPCTYSMCSMSPFMYATGDPKKTEHLVSLDGAKERLHLFKADLSEEGSFDSVVDGCQGVFHTASPVQFSAADPQAEIVDPAVKGTLNVLKACKKVPSVRRVVFTSSMASVMMTGKPLTSDVVVDETWYSDPVVCESYKQWYMLSKTLAEEAAWKYVRENGIGLVTMNPGFVIGPLLQPTLNLSMEVIHSFISGTQTTPMSDFRFIDVRDVASAHIQAFEVPSVSGRYCLVGHAVDVSGILKIIKEQFPTLHLPEKYETGNPSNPTYAVSVEKAKGLGINFHPLEVTLGDTVKSLKEKGFLKM